MGKKVKLDVVYDDEVQQTEEPVVAKLDIVYDDDLKKKDQPVEGGAASAAGLTKRDWVAGGSGYQGRPKPSEEPTRPTAPPAPGTPLVDPFGIGDAVLRQFYTGVTDVIPKSFAQASEAGVSALQAANMDEYIKRNKSVEFQKFVREKEGIPWYKPFGDINEYLPKYSDEFVKANALEKTRESIQAKQPHIIQRRLEIEQYAKQQEKESQEKLSGVPQSYKDIRDPKGAMQYASNLAAQTLWQVPLTIVTRGLSGQIMESAEVYDQQLEQISQDTGLSREEVIKRNLDKPAEGQLYAVAAAQLDKLSAGGLLNMVKKGGAGALKKALAVTQETLTEPVQGMLEETGGARGAGRSEKQAMYDAWTKNLSKRIDEAAGGLFGGGIASVATSPSESIQKEKASIASTSDMSRVEQAAAAIDQAVENQPTEGVQDDSSRGTRIPGEVGVREEPIQAGNEQGGGSEAVATNRVVQAAQGEEVTPETKPLDVQYEEEPTAKQEATQEEKKIPEGFVSLEEATKITPTSQFKNLPKGQDEGSTEARSQMIRDQENTPPKWKEHKPGTLAVDRWGEVSQLREVPINQIVSKDEGTQRKQTIDKYAKWIKETGKVPPAIGVENIDVHKGKIVITDGNHRVQAANKAGKTTVPVWVALTDRQNTARPVYAKDWEQKKGDFDMSKPSEEVLNVARQYNEEEKNPSMDAKDLAIAAVINKVNPGKYGDKNTIGQGMAKAYLRKNGTPIDVVAQTASKDGLEITPDDVWDFMQRFPQGPHSLRTPAGNPKLRQLSDKYSELTGKAINRKIAKDIAEKWVQKVGVAAANEESRKLIDDENKLNLDQLIELMESDPDGYMASHQMSQEDFDYQINALHHERGKFGSEGEQVDRGDGQADQQGQGTQSQGRPLSVRFGDTSQDAAQLVQEITSKPLTHVPGLNMGKGLSAGTYLSTEEKNRYEGTPQKATVKISNPFVFKDENGIIPFRNQVLEDNRDQFTDEDFESGEKSSWILTLEDLSNRGIDKLAELVREKLLAEGYDSIYLPATETQEGELIVFDKANVTLQEQSVFAKAQDLYNQIQTAESAVKKRGLAEKRRTLLEQNPQAKFIDDNLSMILSELEQRNELTKRGDCP